ncbi:hypothetical protein AB4176_03625 [Vibrio splendidus]
MDLNKLFQFVFPSGSSTDADVNFFDNEKLILTEIKKHDAVLGCTPWITNRKIIEALSDLEYGTCIVTDKNSMKKYIKDYLDDFNEITTLDFDISQLPNNNSYFDGNELPGKNTSSIRVFGKPKEGITPLLHYKFLILCDIDNDKNINLKSVIAGSFNLSNNATSSRELLLILKDSHIVKSFYYEWAKAFLLSENINDFSKEEINPEFLRENSAQEIIDNIDKENKWLEREEMKSNGLDAFYN